MIGGLRESAHSLPLNGSIGWRVLSISRRERLAKARRKVIIHEQPNVLEQLKREFGDLFEYEPDS